MADVTELVSHIIHAHLQSWVRAQTPEPDPKAILTKAFEMSFEHDYTWLMRGEMHNERFSAACGAVYSLLQEKHQRVLRQELEALRTLAALVEGRTVDIDRYVQQLQQRHEEPLKAMNLFRQVMEKRRKSAAVGG